MKNYLALFGLFCTFCMTALGAAKVEKKNIANTELSEKGKNISMAQRLIPRQVLFAKPDKITVRLNHAGDKISYIARKGSQVTLVVSELDGKIIRGFEVKATRNLSEYMWSRNDDFIFILQDTNGDENNHIIALNLKDGSQKDLTPFKGARAELVTNNRQNSDEIIIRCNKRNPQWMDTYRLNFVTGKMAMLHENNEYGAVLFNEKLEPCVATKVTEDGGQDVFLFKNGKPELFRHVSLEDSSNSNFIIQSMIVGDRWYYLSSENSTDKNELIECELKNGESKQVFALKYEQSDIRDILFDRKTLKPLFVEVEYLKPDLLVVNEKSMKKHKEFLNRKFPNHMINIASMNHEGTKWIVATSSSTEAPKYYLYNTTTHSLKFLFYSQEALNMYAFHEMEPVVIKSRDGLDLVCYLTRSPNSSKLIMYIHGGPWWRNFYGFNKVVQFLVNRGYSVLQVNYRGSSGFGKKFSTAINMNLDKVRNDIIDAAKWAIDNGIAKSDQVGIMGESFGGYSVLAGLTYTPDFFCCGVDVVGPSNWKTAHEKVPEYWKPFMATWYKCIGDPNTKEGLKTIKEFSPITYVKNIKKPLIVFQGEHDPRVNKQESELIVSEMKKRKIPVSYVVYPDEGHGFVKEANQLSYLAITEQFLAKVFGGWSEPIGKDELKDSSHKIIEKGGMNID